jgi:ribosomal protein S18 acetylase RimI-like enzyme
MEIDFFNIRKVVKEDESFLWDMLYESIYIPEGSKRPSKDIIYEPHIAKYLEEWGRYGDVGFIAVDNNDKPIGSITSRFFHEDNKGYGYVDESTPEFGLAILPEYRGKGIGAALLKRLLEEVESRDIKCISLSVDPNNPAIKLYKKFGFVEVGLEGTSVTMKKELKIYE